MVANMLSFVISRHNQPIPVYHALLHQDGVHLPSAATPALASGRTARHVMQTDMLFMPAGLSVEQAWHWAIEHDAPAYLVGASDRLEGTVTRRQLEQWRESGRDGDPISSLVDGSFVHTHPDHPIDVVLERLSQSSGILPVVSRSDARRVEGVVTPVSILAFDVRRT
jgi:CBS domain-containing protein